MAFKYDPEIAAAVQMMVMAIGQSPQPPRGDVLALRQQIDERMAQLVATALPASNVLHRLYQTIADDGRN